MARENARHQELQDTGSQGILVGVTRTDGRRPCLRTITSNLGRVLLFPSTAACERSVPLLVNNLMLIPLRVEV